jgi:DNA polymerase III delta subunit
MNGENIKIDGSFVAASKSAVAYVMDPRNSLYKNRVFQFEGLSYNEHITPEVIEKVIAGSPMVGTYAKKYKNAGVWIDMDLSYSEIINKVGHIIECNSPKDLKPIVKEMFLNYNISPKALELFIDRVGKNLGILNSEANKIMIYKDNDLNITEEDILNLTSKIIVEEDLFKLVDYIIKKDKKEALIYYNGLLKLEMEPFKIIVTLANKIRLIYQTKELFRLGHTENDIVTILKINPKQIYFLREPIRKYNSEDLINILSKLADLDLNIKSGKIDSKKGLELFILNL